MKGIRETDTKLTEFIQSEGNKIIEGILSNREEILAAFIAETGLLPSECEQVFQGNKWWVQKRRKAGLEAAV